MLNFKNRFIYIAVFLATLLLFPTKSVIALELEVSSNGSQSESAIYTDVSNTTTVQQDNELEINNNIKQTASTGDNSANDNNGDSSINTGDANIDTSLENSGNITTVNLDHPSSDTSLEISGNGAESQNQIQYNQSKNFNTTVLQNAVINNNISGSAVTGNNEANNNGGDVNISTGDIYAAQNVDNININIDKVDVRIGTDGFQLRLIKNGAGSENILKAEISDSKLVYFDNFVYIDNILKLDALSGGNSANGNMGNVSIITGDIYLLTQVTNGPINVKEVEINKPKGGPAPEEEKPGPQNPPPPVQPTPPPAPPSQVSNPGPSQEGGVEEVLAAAAGQILPVTGSYWTILLTLASLMMFILGMYLHLHPGLDPGKKMAIA